MQGKGVMHGRRHAWQGGMCGGGHAWWQVCMAGGMHGGGMHGGGLHGEGCVAGVYMAWEAHMAGGHAWGARGMCGLGGHAWQEKWQLQWAVRILLECILVSFCGHLPRYQ